MMKPSFELFMALRYLSNRRKSLFGLVTTTISVAGIGLGVAALIVTLAIMTGFHEDIRQKILGLNPHIVITGIDTNRYDIDKKFFISNPEIVATAPFIYSQTILKRGATVIGSLVKGVDMEKEKHVIPIEKIIIKGKWDLSSKGIVIGKQLAKSIFADVGDEVILLSPAATVSPFGSLPYISNFTIRGIFSSGIYDYDSNIAYIAFSEATKLTHPVTGVGLKIQHIDKAKIVAQQLKRKFTEEQVFTWEDLNYNLFAALKLEKTVMFIIVALIILVACFNIISNLLLLTMEKAKEIGILSALGATRKAIRRIFFYEGFITGNIGTIIGVITGIVVSLLLKTYQFVKLPPDVYYLDTLPVRLIIRDIFSVVLVAIGITIVASLYPAVRAAKLDPVEIIRYG